MWARCRTLSSRATLLQWLFGGLAAIAVLVMIAVTLVGLLLLEIFYCTYQQLIVAGVGPGLAALIIGGIILLLIFVFLGLAWIQWLRTCGLPRRIIMAGAPLNGGAQNVIDAFMAGFLSPRP
jgi:hypothetical protein